MSRKKLTGADLIKLGYTPSKYFGEMLEIANEIYGHKNDLPKLFDALDQFLEDHKPEVVETIPLQKPISYDIFLDDGYNDYEKANVQGVHDHMKELMKVPTVRYAAVMPDACPAGSAPGTIPVGGVVATENAIHPGMHSADICCSMFLTSFDIPADKINVGKILDAVQEESHFGVGGNNNMKIDDRFLEECEVNSFLNSNEIRKAMNEHFGTQGDGNHFFYIGEKESTGDLTFVTHHGSRKPGALLYKAGMKVAEEYRAKYSPDTAKHNAWIPADSEDGVEYWEALQFIRKWTKKNHHAIHQAVSSVLRSYEVTDQFWNEHNFVFKKDGLFYHAKGSTPVQNNAWDADPEGRTIIPLNMAQPILIAKNHPENTLGFAPHGAGRNMSRTAYLKRYFGKSEEKILKEETKGIDARFYSGKPDLSELPGAYKNADEVKAQIEKYKLAVIVDRVLPMGSMMCGEENHTWRKK